MEAISGSMEEGLCRQKDSRTPNPKQRHSYSFAQHATAHVWRKKKKRSRLMRWSQSIQTTKTTLCSATLPETGKGPSETGIDRRSDAQRIATKTMTCDGFETGKQQGGNPIVILVDDDKRAGHPCMRG